MYTHKNLLPTKVASKTSIKPELRSIAFYGDRTIATDSFRLLEVSASGAKHEPKLLPADAFKATTISKKTIKFDLDEIERTTGTTPNPHANYPDVDIIMKEDQDVEYATVKVNGKLLGELLVQMGKISKYGEVEMKVPINHAHKPVHLYNHDGNPNQDERQTAHGLMMPMNL